MVKVTFTLDERTADRLTQAAQRLSKPKSRVVREAINAYADRLGKLGEEERRALLDTFDRLVPRIPARSAAEVDSELDAVRRARRAGGRVRRS